MRQNIVGWFDIYVDDMSRAAAFYECVLGQVLEDIEDPTDASTIMKGFPTHMDCYGAGGALVKRQGASPSIGGTIVYFSVVDCAVEEKKVGKAGGKVIQSKMSIGQFGFVSVCMDTEGNLFGLSSMQ